MTCTIAVFAAGVLFQAVSLQLDAEACWRFADGYKRLGLSVRVEIYQWGS